jgi:uncharacterized protein (TIGR01777 family)
MSKIIIAGGSGFLGHYLSSALSEKGYDVVVLSRHEDTASNPRKVKWDGRKVEAWADELEGAFAVINLAGESVSKHWSTESKLAMLESRIFSTQAIGDAITASAKPPQVWINSSATGYYGNRGDEILAETSPAGPKGSFLVDVCVAWEDEQMRVATPKTRKAHIRTGVVLGRGGGAFEPLLSLTKFFLGGKVGSGQQYVSWIHVADLVGIYCWVLENEISGAVNGTAPEPVTNEELMTMFRAILRRPWAPPVPAFLLKLVSALGGPEASLLLEGQRALPAVAQEKGYEFRFPRLREALVDLVG